MCGCITDNRGASLLCFDSVGWGRVERDWGEGSEGTMIKKMLLAMQIHIFA